MKKILQAAMLATLIGGGAAKRKRPTSAARTAASMHVPSTLISMA
jgi:hypothetical protein